MAGFINRAQQKRDHNGQRNICAADGHPGTTADPLVKNLEGMRIHRSHTEDPSSAFYGDRQED